MLLEDHRSSVHTAARGEKFVLLHIIISCRRIQVKTCLQDQAEKNTSICVRAPMKFYHKHSMLDHLDHSINLSKHGNKGHTHKHTIVLFIYMIIKNVVFERNK